MSFFILFKSIGHTYSQYSQIQPESVFYTADIHDRFALCKLKQKFVIGVDDITEGNYQFPVDYNSAFCDLLIKTPREEIRANVKEKTVAKKMYDEAKEQGKQAFLTEQTTSDRDIYKLSMCNLLKGDEINVEYTYITETAYSNGNSIFYIPSFISPRYGGNYIPSDNHSVDAKIKINNQVTSIKCSMPDMNMFFYNGMVTLKYNSNQMIEKDIEVIYDVFYNSKAYKFDINGYAMALAQFCPEIETTSTITDIVFVLDCSGSMEGERIENSKKAIVHCLNQMVGKNYHFNIIRYGSKFQMYSPGLLIANAYNINKAIKFCENINADLGGTETYSALKASLEISNNAILITDGDTSNNDDLHQLCKQFNFLSILGIGSGINRANIKDMANRGSGIAVFSQTVSDIIQNIDLIYGSMTTPSIKNPTFNWSENPKNWVSSSTIISRQLNTVCAILTGDDTTGVFRFNELNYEKVFSPYDLPIEPKYICCLIAKRIIQECEVSETFTKEQMTKLAVDFNIITQYTSLIAVSSLDRVTVTDANGPGYNSCGPMGPPGQKGLPGLRGPTGDVCLCSDEEDFGSDCESAGSECAPSRCDTRCDARSPPRKCGRKKSGSNLLTDKNTDYFFEYFMNEDKFNEQLRGELDEQLKKKSASLAKQDVNSDNESVGSDDSLEPNTNFYSDSDIEMYRLIFEHLLNSGKIKITGFLNTFFDKSTYTFVTNVSNVIENIPQSVLNDRHILTVFILICLKNVTGYENVYNRYLKLAMLNARNAELIGRYIASP